MAKELGYAGSAGLVTLEGVCEDGSTCCLDIGEPFVRHD